MTFAWLHQIWRLRAGYEKRPAIHEAIPIPGMRSDLLALPLYRLDGRVKISFARNTLTALSVRRSEVAITDKDREARIFGKAGIGEGEFTKDKNGPAIRRDLTGVETIGAEAGGFAKVRLFLFSGHETRITRAGKK